MKRTQNETNLFGKETKMYEYAVMRKGTKNYAYLPEMLNDQEWMKQTGGKCDTELTRFESEHAALSAHDERGPFELPDWEYYQRILVETKMSAEQLALTHLTEGLTEIMYRVELTDLNRRKMMLAAVSVLQSIYRILEVLSLAPSDDVIDCVADLETYFNMNPLSIKMGGLV